MRYETKIKIEKAIFGAITYIGFLAIGVALGIFLVAFEDSLQRDLTGAELLGCALGFCMVMCLSYVLNICFHEVGHMIFGLLTGYRFHSIRFGKLAVVVNEGKLHCGFFDMPGTGGQCIMLPPEKPVEDIPVVLYNLGGLIVNAVIALVGAGLYWVLKASHILLAMLCMTFALTAVVVLITNGIPLEYLGTDGANAIILHKNRNARKAFFNQLKVMYYLSQNCSIREMPTELFAFDESMPLDNPMITAQAVNHCNYLIAKKMYAEAKHTAQFILENAKSINQMHEVILYGELIFIAAVIERDTDEAKELYHRHAKKLKTLYGFISMQRILYAYFTLVEPDEKKAKDFSKRFASSVKNYPYPKDAEIEQEQFDLVLQGSTADSAVC